LNLAASFEKLGLVHRRSRKWLFPQLPPDVRRRKINTILAVVLVSLLLAGFVGLIMVLKNRVGAL
jgi:hypothetical protein